MKSIFPIIGLETEFAVLYSFLSEDKKNIAPKGWQRQFNETFFDEVKKQVISVPGATLGSDFEENPTVFFLANGGKLYLDFGRLNEINQIRLARTHESGYPEWATPECATPDEIRVYEQVGTRIVVKAFEATVKNAQSRWGDEFKAHLLKQSLVSGGGQRGCHENYQISKSLYDVLINQDNDVVKKFWLPFLATRTIFSGNGNLTKEGFLLSQRSSITNRYLQCVGCNLLYNDPKRGVLDIRAEHFGDSSLRRLQIICGDVLLSPYATWLKVGTTWIVLALFEYLNSNNIHFPNLEVEYNNMESLFNRVNSGMSNNEDFMWSIAIQRSILEMTEKFLSNMSLPESAEVVLKDWNSILDNLEKDYMKLSNEIDWIAKLEFLKNCGYQTRDENFQYLQEVNQKFHIIWPEGAENTKNWDKQVDWQKYKSIPPDVPRAKLRSKIIKNTHEKHSTPLITWNLVEYPDSKDSLYIDVMPDPNSEFPIRIDPNTVSTGQLPVEVEVTYAMFLQTVAQKSKERSRIDSLTTEIMNRISTNYTVISEELPDPKSRLFIEMSNFVPKNYIISAIKKQVDPEWKKMHNFKCRGADAASLIKPLIDTNDRVEKSIASTLLNIVDSLLKERQQLGDESTRVSLIEDREMLIWKIGSGNLVNEIHSTLDLLSSISNTVSNSKENYSTSEKKNIEIAIRRTINRFNDEIVILLWIDPSWDEEMRKKGWDKDAYREAQRLEYYRQAHRIVEKIVYLLPEDPESWYLKGIINLKQKNYEDASYAFTKSLEKIVQNLLVKQKDIQDKINEIKEFEKSSGMLFLSNYHTLQNELKVFYSEIKKFLDNSSKLNDHLIALDAKAFRDLRLARSLDKNMDTERIILEAYDLSARENNIKPLN
ncbi:MAG: proteasome accessory factor PafA2 family protein [Thaumarchaeota archaeon]|nr:proteasome accessory factor PafA2 family protein [Nitrososphaerota archaeon]